MIISYLKTSYKFSSGVLSSNIYTIHKSIFSPQYFVFIFLSFFLSFFPSFLPSYNMRQAFLPSAFAALTTSFPAAQAINFASVDAAPSPSLAGPPAGVNTKDVPYDSVSVSAKGSAAATGVASASTTASQISNSKRG
jgi:hypothetical protein